MTTRLLVAALCCWLALPLRPADAQTAAGEFRRGIGLSHSLAWAEVEPPPSTAFVFPPFAGRGLRQAELQVLRSAGFDFVRLAIDPGPFLQFQGAQRDHLDHMLLAEVRMILASGLAVIVDFHPSDLHPNYRGRAFVAGVGTALFDRFLHLVERTAGLLDGLKSRRVALELMNEPPGATPRWQPMLEAAYRAARRRAPGLTLVLTGAQDGLPEGLLTLRTDAFRNDPALLYTFHYYEPYQFTHQGADWNAARHLADVPYPARARPLADSLDATAAAIAASPLTRQEKLAAATDARRQLDSYRRSDFDRAAIGRSLDRIVAWRRANGIAGNRIFLGEFGARKTGLQGQGPRAAERLQWFRDVREQAEARGFIWAVFSYRGGGGFALVREEDAIELDRSVIEALGLTPTVRRSAAPAD